MAKINSQSSEELLLAFLSMHVPSEYLESFYLHRIEEYPTYYELILHEKEHLIPEEINKEKNVVLDGFCNAISILTHTFAMKKMFLVLKRRRWKVSGTTKHHSNHYKFVAEGMKITPHYVAFLKEYDRVISS